MLLSGRVCLRDLELDADGLLSARNHGVEVRESDVSVSRRDNRLQEKSGKYYALRLGFRQISGIREDDVEASVLGRGSGYLNLHSLLDAGVSLGALGSICTKRQTCGTV